MKYNSSNLYVLWSVSIILGVVLSLFALIFASVSQGAAAEDGITVSADEPDDFAEDTPVPEETPAQSVRLTETADAGREYLDKLIFLGDSTTYGIGYYYENGYSDLCPMSQLWIPADHTLTLAFQSSVNIVYPETDEEIRIVEAAERAKPEYLFITLGVNGISFMDEEYFTREYTKLVRSVQSASPDTKIICNSIYPVAASYGRPDQINNQKIIAANGWIEGVAEATGTRFLNSYEALVGPDGYLPEDCQNGDGLHLTGEAFGKVMTYIRTHAYQ